MRRISPWERKHEVVQTRSFCCGAYLPIRLLNDQRFLQTATIQRDSNLRKSASSSSAVVEVLPAGTQVSMISNRKRSGYYHVQAQDGAVGWVLARNVSVSAGWNLDDWDALNAPATGSGTRV